MAQLNPYLTFDGNCREAMNFYKDCFGGDLVIQTVGESAVAHTLPESSDKVMHSALSKNGVPLLMASDMVADEGLKRGNNIAITLNCGSETEIAALFDKLSTDSPSPGALREEFWGGIYADFIDRFGTRWMLNYQRPQA